ncbi:MAG: acetyl-CoA C-acyltransferase [Roseiflexus sp.]|nr:acetyl-CoA C-acyltransferase [Roseiflexus sp.]MCS7290872.1 acetyl-CoA C-acyltransferase [Roseiflexus sp.]MDW8232747.1 acetyl-CoA C-acyltransferase [Roseiflexaceae bacterium]
MPNANDIVIIGAARTPIGKFQGMFRTIPATDLGAHAVRAAVARAAIDPALVDECIMGNVVSAGLGQAPARQAALRGGLPESVGALTINKVCGSGLKAVTLAAALIRCGEASLIVAGGMESMSRAPYLLPQARGGYRLGNAELVDALIHDGLWCAFEHHHMGHAADWTARTYGVTREQQDIYAVESQARAIAAQDAGAFADEIAPFPLPGGDALAADEPPRRGVSLTTLSTLSPAFSPDGTVTAGNAPGLTDGAAALVVTSAQRAADLGARPLARLIAVAQAAVAPREVFTAPVYAIRRLLAQTATTLDDYDLFEINEAFAAQIVQNIRALNLDRDRLNVHGGAIALGHPIGASGARILVTLIYALIRRGGGRGIAALCLGGGEAVAVAVETL